MTKLKTASKVLIASLIAGGVAWGALQHWPVAVPFVNAKPQIYEMRFGVTVNKFLVLNNRLHLIVPLPVTGESGKVIEIDKVSKKRRGK